MISIFQHTPIWVWALFVFLLYRGVQALRPRQMGLARLLFLPVLFFIWAVMSIMAELQQLRWGIAGFLICLIVGFALGWQLWKGRVSEITFDPKTRTILRPGSPWVLILILFAFVAKFILHAFLAHRQDLHSDVKFNFLFGATSGLVDGIFWGETSVALRIFWAKKNL